MPLVDPNIAFQQPVSAFGEGYTAGQAAREVNIERAQADIERQAEIAGRLAQTVQNAPEEQKETAYQNALHLAGTLGLNTRDLPSQYSEMGETGINALISRARPVEDVQADIEEATAARIKAERAMLAERAKQEQQFEIYKEEFPYELELRRAGAAKTTIGGQFYEKERQIGRAKFLQTEAGEAASQAAGARESLASLQQAKALLPEIQTGALAPMKAQVGAFAQALGVDEKQLKRLGADKATTSQQFQGIMTNMLQSELAKQKGPQTDADAKRAARIHAQLGNTPEANEFLVNTAIAGNMMKIEKDEFMEREYRTAGSYEHARTKWNEFRKTTPLIKQDPDGNPLLYSGNNQYVPAVETPVAPVAPTVPTTAVPPAGPPAAGAPAVTQPTRDYAKEFDF